MDTLVAGLDPLVERATRLLERSPADVTSICWTETRAAEVALGGRTPRTEDTRSRRVAIRVRVGGRSAGADATSDSTGDLERALRGALAAARCADPSPDWNLEAAQGEPSPLPAAAFDPELAAFSIADAQRRAEPSIESRITLDWEWREEWIVSVASFHPPRALARTRGRIEARSGGRRRGGTASVVGTGLSELDPAAVVERARAAEAGAFEEIDPGPAPTLVLAPRAAGTLLATMARRLLSARAEIERGGPFAALLSPRLSLRDEPLDGGGFALPFDVDGCPKVSRSFVEKGRVVASAWDLELAARHGRSATAHGMGADDAWPLHLTLAPGSEDTPTLCRRAGRAVWVSELDALVVEGDPALSFRAGLRGVRRVADDGSLAAALPDLEWRGSLVEVLTNVLGVGSGLVRVAARLERPESQVAACVAFPPSGDILVRAN